MLGLVKFIYSEKATKFCEISTVDLSYVVMVKSMLEISQNFMVFLEYMNFTLHTPEATANQIILMKALDRTSNVKDLYDSNLI